MRFVLLFAMVLTACNDQQNSDERLIQKIDSLQKSVQALNDELNKKELPETISKPKLPEIDTLIKKKPNNQIAPLKVSSIPPKLTVTDPPNTIQQYFYKGTPRRLSVKITGWIDGKRTLTFYNPQGEETYVIHDVRMSYSSVSNPEKFHDNGACALVQTHLNPGASMYWNESEISFDENNYPLWKIDIQKPERSLEQNMNNKSWWDAHEKKWIKQETIKEQPVVR